MARFAVPDQYAGKSLRQIRDETNGAFRPDIIGYDQNIPLTAGQEISFRDDPGSAEYQFLSKTFTPYDVYAANKSKAETDALLAKQKSEKDAQFASNKAEIEGFNTRFSQAVPNVINAASEKYGVNDLLGLTNALNTRIQELKGNTQNQGAGGYANAGQVDRAISTNYAPRYLTASTNLNTAAGLANEEAKMGLAPFYSEAEFLSDRIARESTGYDIQQQRELDTLLTRISQGIAISEAEKDRVLKLAEVEKNYEIAKMQATNKSSDEERYISLGSGSSLYDTQTGKFIKAPKTTGGSSYNPAGL